MSLELIWSVLLALLQWAVRRKGLDVQIDEYFIIADSRMYCR